MSMSRGHKGKCVALKAILIFILEGELLISFLTTCTIPYNVFYCSLFKTLQVRFEREKSKIV